MTEDIKDIAIELSIIDKRRSELNQKIETFCVSVLKALIEFGPDDKSAFLNGDEFDDVLVDWTSFYLRFDDKVRIEFHTPEGYHCRNYYDNELIGIYSFNLDILEFANQPNGFENYFSSQFGLAEKLYNAYGYSADWKNFSGGDMPQWLVLPDKIKDHWRAVAYSTLTLKLDNK